MPRASNASSSATDIHASAVALQGRAVLLLGPSGSGKSALALSLMALGCQLVSDDRTILIHRDGQLWASAPAALGGMIEARGVGILAAEAIPTAIVRLVVDLGRMETDRLPAMREIDLLGVALPLVLGSVQAHFPAAILQYLKAGRIA